MSQRLRPVSPIWVAGRPQHGEEEFFVTHPYDDSPVGATSWVEVVLAILLAIATIAVMIPLAGRIYRGGVLRTRGRVSFREAWGTSRTR